MPRVVEYPHSSLRASLDLSKAISDLGGSAKLETVAEKMGLKVSGSFRALISGAKKYGVADIAGGQLTVTSLYKEYKHAYSDDEAAKVLRKAFFAIPLFQKIYDRFRNTKLPTDILAKVLIREFEVDEAQASRVVGYLLDAGRLSRLLDDNHSFIHEDTVSDDTEDSVNQNVGQETEENQKSEDPISTVNFDHYIVHFKGPGIDSKIQVTDEDDITIVQAMLSKIAKKLDLKASFIEPQT